MTTNTFNRMESQTNTQEQHSAVSTDIDLYTEEEFSRILFDSDHANVIFWSRQEFFWRAICNEVEVINISKYCSDHSENYMYGMTCKLDNLVKIIRAGYDNYATALTKHYWEVLVEVAVVGRSGHLLDTCNDLYPSNEIVDKTVLKSDIFNMLWSVYENNNQVGLNLLFQPS